MVSVTRGGTEGFRDDARRVDRSNHGWRVSHWGRRPSGFLATHAETEVCKFAVATSREPLCGGPVTIFRRHTPVTRWSRTRVSSANVKGGQEVRRQLLDITIGSRLGGEHKDD